MSEPTIEGVGNVPESRILVLPNRADLAVVRALENALGGGGNVAWMVEDSLMPAPEILNYLARTHAAGFRISLARMSLEAIADRVRDQLKTRHVALICGRPGQQPANVCDVPGNLLSCFDHMTLPALPVYAGMFNEEPKPAVTSAAPYGRLHLRIMPPLKAGAGLGARVRAAWMEAEADLFAALPALQQPSLPHALLRSLAARPDALLIDGIDDTQMPYSKLLALSLMMCSRLRKQTHNKALGIILPPGKLAAIANVACLLAGIVPVNINYTASEDLFQKQAAAAGIDRYIAETRFIHKQQHFAWPSQRDLIYIDRELAEQGSGQQKIWSLLVRWAKPDFLAARIGLKQPRPDDTAMVLFTTATGGEAKGVPLSHRMLMAGILQTRSRISLQPGQRVLSAMPLFQPTGLLLGLLLPLLSGADIITYPSPYSPKRLCNLARNYGAALTAFTPSQTHDMLEAAAPDTFAAMRHFIVTGGKLPTDLARRAARDLKLELQESYALAEAAAPVSLCMGAVDPAPGIACVLPAGSPGSVGALLPGAALRISDLNRSEVTLPPTSMGLIWLRGAGVMRGYLDNKPDAASCMRGEWFCTGDVGCLSQDGLLSIHGRKARFSKIGEDLVPHELLEELICRILGVDPADPVRKLAVVGVPNPKGEGEMLVLLSTLHEKVGPQDVISLHYAIRRTRPATWAPDRILAVTSIPTLPNGKLNYPLCCLGTCKMLKIRPNA